MNTGEVAKRYKEEGMVTRSYSERCRSTERLSILPETNDKRTLIVASHILEEGIADIIMIGNEERSWTVPDGLKSI